jgi:hypothetical protein
MIFTNQLLLFIKKTKFTKKYLKIKIKIIVIHKVRKTQHPNPEFVHTGDEIQKQICKKRKTLALRGWLKLVC